MQFASYDPENFYDETFEGLGRPRPGCSLVMEKIASLTDGELKRRQQAAERVLLDMGVTFGVQGEEAGHENIFPFDIVPRIVEASEW